MARPVKPKKFKAEEKASEVPETAESPQAVVARKKPRFHPGTVRCPPLIRRCFTHFLKI